MNIVYEDTIAEISTSGDSSTTAIFASIPKSSKPYVTVTPLGEYSNFNSFTDTLQYSDALPGWIILIQSSIGLPAGTKFHARAMATSSC